MHKVFRNQGRAAFSALELTIAVMLLSLLAGSLSLAIVHMRGISTTSNAQSMLQDSAERAMRRIVGDMSRSGVVTLGLVSYPQFFFDGNASGALAAHAHAPATHHAVAGDPDFGASREIVFALPQESDAPGTFGNDVPDIDANANLIWDPVEFSYVLITGVDGVNYLERRSDGANPITIASNVERIVFDDNVSAGFVLPVDSVRVRLYFRKTDATGALHRCMAEQIIKLRNGG